MTPDSPWRQPIVWLVVALVAAAVVGGVVMVPAAWIRACAALGCRLARNT